MTAQIPEKLHHEGQVLAMCGEPLADYFALAGTSPGFLVTCTALWRGYVGTWEIVDGRLYLIGLEAILGDGGKASLATLFPAFPDRVFAHWFSGRIRVPQGKLLKYVHGGYGSTYERELFFDIERGVVVDTRLQHNATALSSDASAGYVVGAMLVFSHGRMDEGDRS